MHIQQGTDNELSLSPEPYFKDCILIIICYKIFVEIIVNNAIIQDIFGTSNDLKPNST